MSAKLSDAEIQSNLAKLGGWTLINGEITRTVMVKDFQVALLFVNAVGLLAESAQHHPDITIKYNRITFGLTTHDSGGLTDKDFALAAQINALPLPK